MRRTGIDVSSSRCFLVDADSTERRSGYRPVPLRVNRYASLPAGGEDGEMLAAELKRRMTRQSFARRAWVNLWDLRSSHQYLLLPSERADEFESLARRHGAAALGMKDADVTVAIAVGATGEFERRSKTEVCFFAAGTEDIRQRLSPLIQAGMAVEGVTTPCGALWSQARLRRASPGTRVHAHVALGASQSGIAIFSNRSLLYGRDLDWGYATRGNGSGPMNREELAARLSVPLRHSFLYVMQFWEEEVSQIVLCGDMPEIRSLVAPLIERLSIDVETLDTLEGIEAPTLPDGFAGQAAAFRLASSIAAEPPPVNLLPAGLVVPRADRLTPLVLASGTAAAVGVCAFLYGQASVARAEAERQIAVLEHDTPHLQPSREPLPIGGGPSMARLLAAFANEVPEDVVVRSLKASSEGDYWNVVIKAVGTRGNRPPAAAESFLRLEPAVTSEESRGGDVELSAVYRAGK